MSFRAGQIVEIKNPAEIAATLDADGALHHLPFMPEMVQYCGQRFRVSRIAEKTCVEFKDGYKIREFLGKEVLMLELPRCSGEDHDGCQRRCTVFWDSEWLLKPVAGEPARTPLAQDLETLRSKLKTKSSETKYFCQSTELGLATRFLPRQRVVFKVFRDLWTGSRTVPETVDGLFRPIAGWFSWTMPRLLPPKPLAGTLTRTPLIKLELKSGDLVQILNRPELQETLDMRGQNRGLRAPPAAFCGKQYSVLNRLDKMIVEHNGEMRNLSATVLLDGANCLCTESHIGGCPREDAIFFREGWLARAGEQPEKIQPASETTQGERVRSA